VSRKGSWNPRFCPSCAKEIPDRSVFCNLCGKTTQAQATKAGPKPWIVFLLGLFVAGVIAFIVHTNSDAQRRKDSAKPFASVAVQAAPAALFLPVTRPLVAGQLIVKQGSDMNMRAASAGVKVLSELARSRLLARSGFYGTRT
jgi:hypothetical protein